MRTVDLIKFTVLGVAQPAGSKTSYVPRNRDTGQPYERGGRILVSTVDANKKSKPWQAVVAAAARDAYDGPLLDFPLILCVKFFQPRPSGHYGSHDLSKAGRDNPVPAKKPDVLKLARGIEDALTGVIYRDDALIVDEFLRKRWGEPARAEIEIRPWSRAAQEELEARGDRLF